jgi:hypothetical protein
VHDLIGIYISDAGNHTLIEQCAFEIATLSRKSLAQNFGCELINKWINT